MITLLIKAFFKTSSRLPLNAQLPALIKYRHNCIPNIKQLNSYRKLFNFKFDKTVPLPFIHLIAQEIQLELLVDNSFPLKTIGLVHKSNEFIQFRSLFEDMSFNITVTLQGEKFVKSGRQFELLTRFESKGELIALTKSEFIARGESPVKYSTPKDRSLVTDSFNWLRLDYVSNLGRKYAMVSGDFNPIHLNKYLAKLLGFRSSIGHGMYTAALLFRALSKNGYTGKRTFKIEFLTPVYLPSRPKLILDYQDSSGQATLWSEKKCKPHAHATLL